MLLDVFQILEDLSFLLNFALVGRVVMDRQHNRPAPSFNFLTFNTIDVHQQRKLSSFVFAAEVVCSPPLSLEISNKEVVSDIPNIICHGKRMEMENEVKRLKKQSISEDRERTRVDAGLSKQERGNERKRH